MKRNNKRNRIATVVTFLEMRSPLQVHVPPPTASKLMLMRAEQPTLSFYRYLYNAVGQSFFWVDRNALSDAALASEIHNEKVEVWVLYVGGVPAGYFEVDARDKLTVALKYFGLIADFHGRGLGKWFLSEAIKACWAHAPERVIVDTCTLDSPAALPLYQKMGFIPYAREERVLELPVPSISD